MPRFSTTAVLIAMLRLVGDLQGQPTVVINRATSPIANHPSVTIPGLNGHKLLGGGGHLVYSGAGSLLFGIYPNSNLAAWSAMGKDHMVADPASITAYSLELSDPTNIYEVIMVKQTSPLAGRATARASLPAGYVMTGGGCFVNWNLTAGAPGNLLTGSYPDEASGNTWICESRDLLVANPAYLDAYVIGIRPRVAGMPMPTMTIVKAQSGYGSTVAAQVLAPPGYIVTGGGGMGWSTVVQMVAGTGPNPRPTAETDPTKQSAIFLAASFPVPGGSNGVTPIGWTAAGIDHALTSPGYLMAYAVAVKFPFVAGPSYLTAASAIPARIDLRWRAVPNATSYRVMRWTASQAKDVLFQIPANQPVSTEMSTGDQFTFDYPVDRTSLYSYEVLAWVPDGTGTSVLTPPSPTAITRSAAIAAPTGLTYTATPSTAKPGGMRLTLRWNPVPGATSYYVTPSGTGRGTQPVPTTVTPPCVVIDDPSSVIPPGCGGIGYSASTRSTVGLCVSTLYLNYLRDDSIKSCVTIKL